MCTVWYLKYTGYTGHLPGVFWILHHILLVQIMELLCLELLWHTLMIGIILMLKPNIWILKFPEFWWQSLSLKRSTVTITVTPLSLKKEGPNFERSSSISDSNTWAVKWSSSSCRGFSAAQQSFCLLTVLKKWKWASSVDIKIGLSTFWKYLNNMLCDFPRFFDEVSTRPSFCISEIEGLHG